MMSFEKAADVILSSKRKYIAATRGNSCLCDYFSLYLKQMVPHVIMTNTASLTPIDHMCSISREDCLILFSFPRYSSIDKVTAEMAQEAGANIIIITDCQNGKRFNLTEKEIVSNSTAKSEYEKLEKLMPTHVAMCEARVKNNLNYPSTYKRLISQTGWETENYVNDIVIGFKAKNAFNLETEHVARCMLNAENEFTLFNIKEKK